MIVDSELTGKRTYRKVTVLNVNGWEKKKWEFPSGLVVKLALSLL